MSFDLQLTDSDKAALLKTARLSIESHFSSQVQNYPRLSKAANGNYGAFVSLHSGGTLRGCIGYIRSEKPLLQTITEAAKSAAFSDYRFKPVSAAEVKQLEIEISVLSPFKPVKKPDEIIVGRHGIYITSQSKSGILLPQVATEYNWNKREFLSQTCRKAGLPKDAWKQDDCKIEIFTAVVFS
jgi:AmmeMemoRadiSam system protein A